MNTPNKETKTPVSIREQAANLGMVINKSRVLALAITRVLNDISGIEDQGTRDLLGDVQTLTDLVFDVSVEARKAAEVIECASGNFRGAAA